MLIVRFKQVVVLKVYAMQQFISIIECDILERTQKSVFVTSVTDESIEGN